MAHRQTYTVLVPFPTGGGHWSSVGQQLELLDVEARALRTAGRLELSVNNYAVVDSTATDHKALKATARKAQ